MLIETGPESCRDELLKGIRDRGVDPNQDIRSVFVTHIHLDHSGGAGWWAGNGVPVYVHPKGAKHLVDPIRLVESARMIYGDAFDALWGEPIPADEGSVKIVQDDEIVETGGLEIRAIDTPGHAFHHHAFRVEGNVFSGDAAGVRLSGLDYISVASAPPQFHLEHTLASIDRLRGENCESLFLTHFGEIREPDDHLAAYRETVSIQTDFVRQRMEEGMEAEAIQVAYEAFNLERAFQQQVPSSDWARYQATNPTGMCADGIRLFLEKQ